MNSRSRLLGLLTLVAVSLQVLPIAEAAPLLSVRKAEHVLMLQRRAERLKLRHRPAPSASLFVPKPIRPLIAPVRSPDSDKPKEKPKPGSSSSASSASSSSSSPSSVTPQVKPDTNSGSMALFIDVQDSGDKADVVKNQKNVLLLRFTGITKGYDDALFTGGTFRADAGTLLNAQNYTLWADTDHNGSVDTILQKGVADSSNTGLITFDKIIGGGYVVARNRKDLFEVHADMAAALTSNTLQLGFAVKQPRYVTAQEYRNGADLAPISTNGSCDTRMCKIFVTTRPSVLLTIYNQGSLFIVPDGVIRNHQYLGGTLGESALNLVVYSTHEPVAVRHLQITTLNGKSYSSTIDRLELYREGEFVPFGTATIAGCGADDTYSASGNSGFGKSTTFCARLLSQQLIAKPDMKTRILVKPVLKDDTVGGVTNETIRLFIDGTHAMNEQTGSGAVRGTGMLSSNDLSANNGNSLDDGEVFIGLASPAPRNIAITGVQHVSVLSKILSITDAYPGGSSAIPTGVSDLGMFKITAAYNTNAQNGYNTVVLAGLIFNVTANNVAIDASSLFFYNVANAALAVPCIAKTANGAVISGTASGSFLVDCSNLTSIAVDKGSDETFSLKGTITNNKVVGSLPATLQTSIQNFNSIARTAYGANGVDSHFSWIDRDDAATTTASFLWFENPVDTINSKLFSN